MRRVAVAAVCLSLVVAEAGSSPAYRAAAVDAGRWLAATAVTTPEGAAWPPDPAKPGELDSSLYSGSPGPVLFFLELARQTGDAAPMKLARAGADALLASIAGDKATGLYTGLAGTGFTLTVAHAVTGDEKYLEGARRVVSRMQELAVRRDAGVEWNDVTDIISGGSGTGLFLLWAADRLQLPAARDLAVDAGRRLMAVAERRGAGRLAWMMTPKSPRELPNFSHGTAGVAYFLATLYQHTGERSFLDAALAGAEYLLSIADVENERCLVFHNDTPEGRKLYYLSWCHGPAGTARLFYRLHEVTKDARWMSWFNRSARSVVAAGAPEIVVTPGEWDNISVCCGTTGQAQFFLNAFRVTNDAEYLELARRATERLLGKATRDERGLSWSQAEHRVQPQLRVAQTGYMQGASGVGLWLLHFSAFMESKQTPLIVLPDNPFAF